jgi:hypothetical protein
MLRWDGSTASFVDGSPILIKAFASVDEAGNGGPPALYAGGFFNLAGGNPSAYIARLGCDSCYANCDGSTVQPVLNANDFQCFLNKFASGDPYANCDGSTVPPTLNVNDFMCFLNEFAAGCN